ncbi:lipopolysaccharide biosynthesis protein [Rhodoligotrophos defluvii]|uniref:lipopolysaccharide biosynthesis protein n=1 Tax=Rhodoligotrophos defluvii TaxID=2561934 RepID=UPI001EF08AF1|nr:oligosaccharide flippase family protein [Rhodoligotrophos defluvii]
MISPAAVRSFGRQARRFWREEAALRRRLVNTGHLLTGNVFGSAIGLVAFVLTARALGPTDYGILALTLAYVRAVERLIAFQSWQPLIKYGAEVRGREHLNDYRALLKFGLLVDIGAAATAYLTAIGLALLFGPLVGISAQNVDQVLIYATVLLFQISGFPTAVMRLAGRFKLTAYGALISSVLRLGFCAVGLITGQGLRYFVIVWTVTQIIGALTLLGLAFWEIRRQGVRRLLWAPLTGVTRRFKGLLSFTVGSNVELTLRSSANEFDTLLVGMLAGPAAAGLYHIAKRLGRLVLQLGVQVQAVLYPDVARLWADNAVNEFRRAVLQIEVMLAGIGVALVIATALVAQPVLAWTAGPSFADAASLAVVQMLAVTMTLSGSAVRTALLAMGRQPSVLRVVSIATVAFHLTAFSTIPFIGAMGGNIAHVVMALVWLVGLSMIYRTALPSQPARV